ncbi:MAG: ankyrin repeat domain-containing protein [Planctomycetota bacterium]
MKNISLVLLIICVSSTFLPGISIEAFAGNESETNPEAEQHFQKANELHILADYDAAIAEYEKVISLSPDSKIAQNAQYWIGQLYFESKQFDAALSAFQKLLDEYLESRTIPATTLMIKRVQQAMKNRSLLEAVKKGDIEQVKLLIAEGADVDAKWGDTSTKEEKENTADYTPLYCAVDSNNMDLVKLLVEADADVNAGSWPPLCQALYKGNTTIAKFLIDHGANVNYPEDWGPLHEASIYNIEMVKLLLARGANVNGGNGKHEPALYAAIRGGHRDIVELLIQHGADVNAKNNTWRRVYTPLQRAAITGRTEAVKLLLEAGANISVKDDRGQTLLHLILDMRNSDYNQYRLSKDTVELLLAKGEDVNLKDNDGRTPLHLAAESDDRDIVGFLLDKGAKIDEKDDESGFTALHHAARFGNKNVAELLITNGADINTKDKQGHTPLYIAVNHDYKVAELLIDKGADSGIRTESGRTLLQLAQQRKQTESTVPDLIFDGDPNSLFGLHIVCGDVDGDGYDDILIGAPSYNNKRGRVCLFYGGPDMDNTADLILEGQNEGDQFGDGIACGDVDNDGCEDIIVAACGYSETRGCAYLYWGGDRKSMDANPDKIFVGEEEKGSQFGWGYPAVYDIDNDGYDDIIFGASHSFDVRGRAYLYYGNKKELMDTSADLIFTAENPEYYFGNAISCGDVDNDGYGDIVIGGYTRQGARTYLYYGGSKSDMDAKADVIFKAQSEGNDFFGCGIVCVDQNRDGYDDIIIATGYNNKQGRAYLFHGNSKRSLDADPDMVFDGEVEGSNYGLQEVCGDIDGDKVNDIVIGAYCYRQQVGRVYVYWGNELAGPDPKPGRILTGENPNDQFGCFGLACGDVNNDGFDDLVIGACRYKAGAKQGRAYLYYGGPRNK